MGLRLSRHWAAPITLVASALALMPLGPLTAASASPTGPTQPGVSRQSDITDDGLAIGAGSGGLVAMHNELLGSDPSDGAQLDTGPARVALTFDAPAKRGFSTVVVTGPDGRQWQAGPVTEEGALVLAPVRPLGPAGDYTVAWRIISTDGHPTRGTFRFTLTRPGPGAAAAPPNANGSQDATNTKSAGTVAWPWLAGAAVLLVIVLVLTLRARRTRG